MSSPIQIGARRATADIAVQIAGRIGNLALGVAVTLVIIRALGVREFGEWSTIFAITQIATNLGELGINQAAISRAAAVPEEEGQWLGGLMSLRAVISVPTALAAILAVLLIAPSKNSEIAGVMIACTLLLTAPSALGAVFQLRVRNDISMAVLSINSVAWGAAVVTVAAWSGGIVAYAAGFVLAALLTSVVTVIMALRMMPLRFVHTGVVWRNLMRVGFGVGAAGILVTSYARLDQILVLEYAGARGAGLYGAAYRVLDQVQFIPASVMTTLFPLIASSYPADLARVRRLLQQAAEYVTIASLPILAFTIVAADPIAAFLFGHEFLAAAPALPILMGAFVSISFGYIAGGMVVILELQRFFLRYAALGLALNAGLNLLLIPRYGFLAAAWTTLATEVTVMVLMMHRVLLAVGLTLEVRRLARTVVAAAVMGAAVWGARVIGLPLAGLVGVALLSYPVAIGALGVLSLGEVRALLRRQPAETGRHALSSG